MDGSKSREKSGGGWIIADVAGSKRLYGFNPDFGDISQINSHRADIYGTLVVFMFVHEYCQFYKMKLQSPIKCYCDKKEVVTKLSNITERSRNYYSSNSKMKDLDVVLEIQKYIPTTVTVTYVRGHQDKKKRKEQNTIVEKQNIMADKIIGKYTSHLKPIHIRNTPMVVYIHKIYIPNNIRKETRSHCGAQDAARFLKGKYY